MLFGLDDFYSQHILDRKNILPKARQNNLSYDIKEIANGHHPL